jgi:hypothetical protein
MRWCGPSVRIRRRPHDMRPGLRFRHARRCHQRRVDLGGEFLDLPGVQDKLERVELLVLLHQLEISQLARCVQSCAVRKTWLRPSQHRGHELVLALGDHALGSGSELRVRDAKIVHERFAAVGIGQGIESL